MSFIYPEADVKLLRIFSFKYSLNGIFKGLHVVIYVSFAKEWRKGWQEWRKHTPQCYCSSRDGRNASDAGNDIWVNVKTRSTTATAATTAYFCVSWDINMWIYFLRDRYRHREFHTNKDWRGTWTLETITHMQIILDKNHLEHHELIINIEGKLHQGSFQWAQFNFNFVSRKQ